MLDTLERPLSLSTAMPAAARDIAVMRHALALGARHLGAAAPNPSVGAVVVRDTHEGPLVVGRGVTAPGGRPHAERIALEAAGEAARGATLYVTLEPCSHHGVTPPCVEAVLASGVARVVVALEDPDRRVAGRGIAMLREAGIDVTAGICEDEARRAHLGHILRVREGRPMLALKIARSADGFCGGPNGQRVKITQEISDAQTHLMRARHDAILVGVGTVLADDPLLTCRLPGLEHRSPVRIVIDSALRTPATSHLVTGARQVPTILITTLDAPVEAERAIRAHGADVWRVASGPDSAVDLAAAMRLAAEAGFTRVMSEGGPRLGEALALAGLADEVTIVTSAHPLGHEGLLAVRPGLARLLADPARYAATGSLGFGPDRWDSFEKVG